MRPGRVETRREERVIELMIVVSGFLFVFAGLTLEGALEVDRELPFPFLWPIAFALGAVGLLTWSLRPRWRWLHRWAGAIVVAAAAARGSVIAWSRFAGDSISGDWWRDWLGAGQWFLIAYLALWVFRQAWRIEASAGRV